MGWGYDWRPYVSVAERRAQALAEMSRLRKKGLNVQPVHIAGREIASTFWGQGWCDHLEKFSDFANRLPRGRTYVRNGLVCHLEIRTGKVLAKVCGSALYDIEIGVKTLPAVKWQGLKERCAGQVGSLLELLQGRLSGHVMTLVTDTEEGLFPLPKEISLDCSCPDWADMCKHVAATLYGVGARLDEKPELIFLLRGVDHTQLVGEDAAKAVVAKAPKPGRRILKTDQLAEVFGIDLDVPEPAKKRSGKGAATQSDSPGADAPAIKHSKPPRSARRSKHNSGRVTTRESKTKGRHKPMRKSNG